LIRSLPPVMVASGAHTMNNAESGFEFGMGLAEAGLGMVEMGFLVRGLALEAASDAAFARQINATQQARLSARSQDIRFNLDGQMIFPEPRIMVAGADAPKPKVVVEAPNSSSYLDSTTPADATVHHGKYSTAIGDDASIIDNFQVATDTGQGHNVIVHGHRPGYDDAGGVFVVNDQATHTQQIADALMSNPNYKPGCPVFLASCWSGSNGTAQELANTINANVTAPTRPVSFDEFAGQWEQLSDLGMAIRYSDFLHVKPEFRVFHPVKK
jgi:hypothetical protein